MFLICLIYEHALSFVNGRPPHSAAESVLETGCFFPRCSGIADRGLELRGDNDDRNRAAFRCIHRLRLPVLP
jgi:hypothetical protein